MIALDKICNLQKKLHWSQCKYSRFRKKSEVKRSIIHWENILCRKRFADTLHLVA